ncbi:uncharacterized protein N7484_004828 [Penicillium longicatenatum]|uniref:uncharacterized protein n=1 Tax=Penicillium longicatenatum TaxID=1561947 RepID=UPI00254997A0|nr:uncharacterized protein N7484_004828 [Penicillium longicatenatum]KAJ5651105.1 hypothetical protein N7484_004828 [Penicillium longicatenatum]
MSFLRSIYLRLVVFVLRGLVKLRANINPSYDYIQHIPSRDGGRSITAHAYCGPKSESKKSTPSPVLINLFGCGYTLPLHGSDSRFCREISQRTGWTVLDVSYRLAPENPFPAQLHDAEDVIKWVLSNPDMFDPSRISVSGFSSGGNLALSIVSSKFSPENFHSVIAFYPGVESYRDPGTLVAPQPGGKPMPPFIMRVFFGCWIPDGVDMKDPRISPGLADPARFPKNVLMITAGHDSMAEEAERLAEKLREDPERNVVAERMDRCNHGWDKKAVPGTRDWDMTCKAYDMVVEMIGTEYLREGRRAS